MEQGTKYLILGITLGVIVIGIFIGSYINNKNITANTIRNLERQLEEQGQLTEEQERQLEELAKVECKDVQIPYDAQEAYTEQEPYSKEVCENINLLYKLDKGSCIQYKDNLIFEDEPAKYSCTITNLGDSAGTFSVKIGFTVGGQKLLNSQNKYIYPSSSHTFYAEEMAKIENCWCYEENIPTKQECETITEYKTVTKYRTITKYRTETVCE
ncbi:hypothetical protein ES703_84833 [subsurface metagenome]